MTASDLNRLHKDSLNNPDGFWGEAASAITWSRRWDKVLDDSDAPSYRWFAGGRLNTCYNALDRHADGGRGDQAALIYDSPVTGSKRTLSYAQLRDDVAKLAGALTARGVTKGDRVIVYMPMIPEAAMAMLACARIGAVHSVVFGGFAAEELAKRINDAAPKLVLAASCGIEPGRVVKYKPLLDQAIELSTHKPDCCLIFQRKESPAELTLPRDHDWSDAVAAAAPVDCVDVAATDPLYVLYTSGTTGSPKGVVRDNGGHAVAMAWSMQYIYGANPGDVFWAASDVGWVVGHSYIVYAPLIHGCTTVMYEGKPVGTPDPGAFWRVIEEHAVKVLFTAPTAFRAIKKEDPNGEHLQRYDLSGFDALYLAGERCDPDTLSWAEDLLGVPVIDHWWQTETGWTIAGQCRGIEMLEIKPGSPGPAVPGYDVRVLDEDGNNVAAGDIGNIVIRLPLPPGTLPTLWHDEARYRESYLSRYDGYYLTGDAGFVDDDGYVYVMSRIDDIINVAGHRLSTGAMEEAIAGHPAVAECAVVGAANALKGQVPVGIVVLKDGVSTDPDTIRSEIVQQVRNQVGPVAAFRSVCIAKRLPKTRSGKVLRKTIRAIADGESVAVPPTIDDPAILGEIEAVLKVAGFCKPVA